MLRIIIVSAIFLFSSSAIHSVEVDSRIVDAVEMTEETQLISHEQVDNCSIDFSTSNMFHIEQVGEVKYLMPKKISMRDESREYIYIEYEYGSIGMSFNDTLASLVSSDWGHMILQGLSQESNQRTGSYYLSRFFPFSANYPLLRQVFVDLNRDIFIMKSENNQRYQVVTFIMQKGGISIQHFGGKKMYASYLLKDLGISCETKN
jgi:hypothetical protein